MWRVVVLLPVALWGAAAHGDEYTWVRAGDPGRMACAAGPPGWREASYDDSATFAPRDLSNPDAGVGCNATQFLRWRFDVGPERERIATITLRIRYQHGFAAWLNGVEIGRRRLDPAADAAAPATETHGPEFERLFITARPGLLRPTGNVLAVEVHGRTTAREPFADAEVSGTDGVRIVRGPWLMRLGEREVTVAFDTDVPTLGELHFGEHAGDSLDRKLTDAPAQTRHALRLTRLSPGTAYRYRVTARRSDGEEAAVEAVFRTPPAAGQPLRFTVYGDVRSGHDVHALLNQRLAEEDPDLAILTGDLVDRGSDEGDWEKFFEVAGTLLRSLGIFPAPGNHEYARLGRGAAAFMQLFRWPLRPGEEDAGYYSFDAAGVHFVALDSNQYRSPRQLAWLDRDLAAARRKNARAIFAYAHEPPYSTGMHGDNAVCIRDIVPILERHKISMFFGGHDHHYERGRKGALDYLVTGGGGAELRAARCGVQGRKPCPPHVQAFFNDHHYVMVDVLPGMFRVCPKRIDGSAIEPCITYPLTGGVPPPSSAKPTSLPPAFRPDSRPTAPLAP